MKYRIIWCALSLLLLVSWVEVNTPVTIFMIGDSTMANKRIDGGNPERGWGHALPRFFDDKQVVIDNHAQNGRSSKSFIDEGRWDAVLAKIKKGDYVFIQFGHNDEKPKPDRHTEPGSTFDENLRRFVNETRSKGGIPVLFNAIVRRNFNEEGVLVDTHGAYLDSPRNVAKELDVLFIDMNKMTHDLVQNMGVEASKKLFVWIEPNTVPIAPKGKEDNTHLNVYGARTLASMVVKVIEEQIPELGKHTRWFDYVVAKDGTGDFFTVQEAINAVPDLRKNMRTTILIRKGEYKEKLIVPQCKANISLVGEDGAVLTYDSYANALNAFGEPLGTSGSSACYIYASDFSAENITFENSAGAVGQAVACFIEGDRAYFKNCRFLGFQDTLYNHGRNSRQYFEDCYIEGTVDFIFGWSTAVFNRCTIHSKRGGYLTAPATDKGKKYGYVFYDCKLTADEGVNGVYLSRPWRPYGKTVFIRCEMGKHIRPEGWNNWGKPENEKTAYYAEYKSTGEGANPTARAKFSHQLKNLDGYSIQDVLKGYDGWNPVENGNKLVNIAR
ncbi:pectin esterase [Bacteroides sp. 214]|uniref:pectinesterase family protein n=1 Tax=Bacteroides sp. 214 TaxID=2302935 RepID=UPI0013D35E9E|nr:pectinesterase family protein [Bacteroides sp. 214]NDW13013.1 pectin esterase [Bacteroides sp. 214]